jgi:hypothetical protein
VIDILNVGRKIAEKLRVLDSVTLYKTGKWWSAIALVESFGRKQIAFYVWLNACQPPYAFFSIRETICLKTLALSFFGILRAFGKPSYLPRAKSFLAFLESLSYLLCQILLWEAKLPRKRLPTGLL